MRVVAILLFLVPIGLAQSACRDKSFKCSNYVREGLCNKVVTRDCMKKTCALSCGFCQPPTAAPSPPPVSTLKPPQPGTCGRSPYPQSRIILGKDAKPGAWPWMASLWRSKSYSMCGGALLNPKWVLTASHCVSRSTGANRHNLQIKLGEHDHTVVDGNEQIIDIERIIMHPKFSGWSVKNDIALIKLKTPAKLTARVQPICLPAKNTRPPVGFRDCYLAGWGSIEHPGLSHPILQQGMLPVVDIKHCHDRADMICTGFGKVNATNACRGDSGGPLFCKRKDGSWEQHGIASFVVEFCKYYTAFAQVSSYIDWMNKYINDMS